MWNHQEILVMLLICSIHVAEGGMQKCPEGYKDVGGRLATKCVPCGPGWEDNPNSSNSCQKCAAGSYSDQRSNVVCAKCTVGKFPNSQSTACVGCPDGQVENVLSGTCENCSIGTFADDAGQECITPQRKITSEARENRTSLLTSTLLATIPCFILLILPV